MIDKQIIIDGVDISGCEFYWREKELCNNGNLTSDCQENKDCLYKKYKRKEQECERLKEGYSELTEIVSPYMDDFTGYNEELGGFDIVLCVKQLMEQLDQLKRQHESDKGLITSTGKMNYQLLQEYDKLKTALTEIKEIADIINDRTMVASYICDHLDKILQKISEVVDDRNE